MEFTRTHVAGLGLLAVLGIATHGLSRSAHDAPVAGAQLAIEQDARVPSTERSEQRTARALEDKVDALTAEVEALRALVAQQRGSERAAQPSDEVLPTEAEQNEMWEEYVSYAEAGFNDEPTDARWAADTGAMIQRQLASQPALRSATKAIECRSRTCRMELRDDGSPAFGQQLPELVHELGPQISSVVIDVVKDAQGKRTQVLYMTRAEPEKHAERAL